MMKCRVGLQKYGPAPGFQVGARNQVLIPTQQVPYRLSQPPVLQSVFYTYHRQRFVSAIFQTFKNHGGWWLPQWVAWDQTVNCLKGRLRVLPLSI